MTIMLVPLILVAVKKVANTPQSPVMITTNVLKIPAMNTTDAVTIV
jgi:hypothetical protein